MPGVLALFAALLSEQRVVFVSSDLSRLSLCMHSAIALLCAAAAAAARRRRCFSCLVPVPLLVFSCLFS